MGTEFPCFVVTEKLRFFASMEAADDAHGVKWVRRWRLVELRGAQQEAERRERTEESIAAEWIMVISASSFKLKLTPSRRRRRLKVGIKSI